MLKKGILIFRNDLFRATPSKEMAAALKVINDSLQKSSMASLNLQSATKVVQKEWFKVSSTETANPLDVEDYLDCFEEYSSDLFRFMVNLPDTNVSRRHVPLRLGS